MEDDSPPEITEEIEITQENIEMYIDKISKKDGPESNEVNMFLYELFNNSPIFTLTVSAQLLSEYDGEVTSVPSFCAQMIKLIFTVTESRPIELMNFLWFGEGEDDRSELRDLVKGALVSKINTEDDVLQNLCASALANICKIDEQFYNELSAVQLNEIKEANSIELVSGALKFFVELFSTNFLHENFSSPPPIVTELISEVPNMFFENYEITIRNSAVELTTILFDQCIELFDNQKVVEDLIAGITKALLTIDPAQMKMLHIKVFSFLSKIARNFYGHIDDLWESLAPLVIEKLKCTDPPEAHGSGDIHEKMVPVLIFWKKFANYECQLLKKEEKCFNITADNAEEVVPLLLHLLYPSDPNNAECESVENAETSFYASCALDSVCKIAKDVSYPIIKAKIDEVLEDPSDPGEVNSMLLEISSLTHGPPPSNDEMSEELNEFLKTLCFSILPESFVATENLRIKESALFAIYRILKRIPLSSEDEFNTIMGMIDANKDEQLEIRKRCADILKETCMHLPVNVIDDQFRGIFELAISIAGPECMTKPFNTIFNVIQKCSEKNTEDFKSLLNEKAASVAETTITDQSQLIGNIIVIGALTKKLGKKISEMTDYILEALFKNLDSDNVQLWQETLMAIIYLLDVGNVSPEYYEKFEFLISAADDSKDSILMTGAMRIFGKYIASLNDGFNEQIVPVLRKFKELVDNDPKNIIIITGAMLALSELTKVFSEKEAIQTEEIGSMLFDLLNIGINAPICDDTPKIANGIFVTLSNIYRVSARNVFEVIARKSVRQFVLYIEKLSKEGIRNDDVIKSACSALVFAGRAFSTRVNQYLNRTKVLAFVNYGKESENPEIREFATKTYEDITSL